MWGGGNIIIFLSNGENLFVAYNDIKTKKMVLSEINSDKLEIYKTYHFDSLSMNKYSSIFMIGYKLFCIDK